MKIMNLNHMKMVKQGCGSGSGIRIQGQENEEKEYFFSLFFLFLQQKAIKIVQTAKIFDFFCWFFNLWKNLSSKVLLWIRIRIGSGFNDLVDVDPDPYPDWINPDPQPCGEELAGYLYGQFKILYPASQIRVGIQTNTGSGYKNCQTIRPDIRSIHYLIINKILITVWSFATEACNILELLHMNNFIIYFITNPTPKWL
jgi:hypothetical protein